MNQQYVKHIKKYCPKIYKTYLLKLLDEDQIKAMYKNSAVNKAFKNAIDAFYRSGNCGNNKDPEFISALKEYERVMMEETGFQDTFFRQFLHIYRFYSTSMMEVIVNKYDVYVTKKEKEFFNDMTRVCVDVTENLFSDLQNGYRWWEYDCASTLRRQFLNDKVVLPEYRLQGLCRAYLGREINIPKELHLDQKRSTPPLELVNELDRKMEQHGFVLVNSWVEVKNGQRVVVESKNKPASGIFYKKNYISREKYAALNERDLEK